ncbi:hypothetical protein O6H91_16G053500 [Diphasiastrum complanatum]|uniref:Uncharacterized protein n=1 Tax=Diphasiastrum complanatum TaxID=34168 RepID=A0ACC2BCB3_DIPCM|nr:hypothetical protein O6H91_16G053500 [Diphasiastrum complanatum]
MVLCIAIYLLLGFVHLPKELSKLVLRNDISAGTDLKAYCQPEPMKSGGGGDDTFTGWCRPLAEVGMERYSKLFADNLLDKNDIIHLDHELLSSIGIRIAKHRLLILKSIRSYMGHKGLENHNLHAQHTAAETLIKEKLLLDGLNESSLWLWIQEMRPLCKRSVLIDNGYLKVKAPKQGSQLILNEHLSSKGSTILFEAKVVLWAALYGDSDVNVSFTRVHRELLCITVPQNKATAFDFFREVTEVQSSGTWRDGEETNHDVSAPNRLLQVEYGEVESHLLGDATLISLHLINLLQVNELILYARILGVHQSTLSNVLLSPKISDYPR